MLNLEVKSSHIIPRGRILGYTPRALGHHIGSRVEFETLVVRFVQLLQINRTLHVASQRNMSDEKLSTATTTDDRGVRKTVGLDTSSFGYTEN
ncbi:hypothetical protein TNCT_502301 [Trichonephila clavata]|uniref:Uncharacterized protein n=1 Tax=Trichonephila clavata TaxID=2740835 RepID=A0A8X6FTE7_TRICU|nr:hypothetical protein TNCT_502301 [Trichonephila clavata]